MALTLRGNGQILSDNYVIDSDGTMGMGTTSPAHALHIKGSYPYIALEDTDNGATHYSTVTGNNDGNIYYDANFNNVGGVNGGHIFRNNGATVSAMSIHSAGYVTTPYQLHISGTPNNSVGYGIANAFYTYQTPVGLSFSNSRITVPIAGNYMICWNTIADAGTGRVDTYIRVNGSQLTNGMGDSNHTDFRYRGNAVVVRLAANDYIQFEHQDYYNSPLTSFNNWNHASVTLLG